MTAPTIDRPVLTDATLDEFARRAPVYDRENRFFSDVFEEIRKSGYLKMAIPKELGGLGMNLSEVCEQQTAAGAPLPGNGSRNKHAYLLDRSCGRHAPHG